MNIDSTNFDIDAFVEDTFKDDRVTTSYSKQDAKLRARVNVLKREVSDIGKQKDALEKKLKSLQAKFDDVTTIKDSLMLENRKLRNLEYKNNELQFDIGKLNKELRNQEERMIHVRGELSVANDMINFAQRYIDYIKEYLPEDVKDPIKFYAEVRHEYK
jgi:predicted RNase H-like nuclease (RuvC/YqgF family)